MKRDIKGPLPVRVRLSGILSGLSFSEILFSGILTGIRLGLHRGNPRATSSILYIHNYVPETG